MKKLMLLLIVIAFNATGQTLKKLDGFRGETFGKPLSDMTLFTLSQRKDLSYGVCYIKKDDKISIGEANLTKLFYCTWDGLFMNVEIATAQGEELKRAVQETYGLGFKPNQYMERYLNNIGDTYIFYDQNPINKGAELMIGHKPTETIREKGQKSKAAEAKKDF